MSSTVVSRRSLVTVAGSAPLVAAPHVAPPVAAPNLASAPSRDPMTGWFRADYAGAVTQATIQAAINAAAIEATNGGGAQGETVFIPAQSTPILVQGSILLKSLVSLVSFSRAETGSVPSDYLLNGDGKSPVLLGIPAGSTTGPRNVRLVGISAYNGAGVGVLEMREAHNLIIDDCSFVTANSGLVTKAPKDCTTVRLQRCDRASIENSTIVGSWAMGLVCIGTYDVDPSKCVASNGLNIRNNRLGTSYSPERHPTREDMPVAVVIGQTSDVNIDHNIFTEQGARGILIGGGPALNNAYLGSCHSIRITNNYFERVAYPIDIGEKSVVRTCSIMTNMISAGGSTVILSKYATRMGIRLGRIVGSTICNNTFASDGPLAGPAIQVEYVTASAGSNPAPENCSITNNFYNGVVPYKLVYPGNSFAWFPGRNVVDFPAAGTVIASGVREYISPEIAPGATFSERAIARDATYGGVLLGIDIIDATAPVNVTVSIPTLASALTSWTTTATAIIPTNAPYWLTLRLSAKSSAGNTSSFRIRVRWHGV